MFKHIIDQSDIFQDTRAYFEESASFFCPLEVLCLALSKVFDLNIELNRLITMRSEPDYVEFILLWLLFVVVVLIVVAVRKGLVVVDKSLSDTH